MKDPYQFSIVEPLMSNRYIIDIKGFNIPKYVFSEYKIYNDGDDLIFETSIYETVNFFFNPVDIFNITDISVENLDPCGTVVNALDFSVKGSNIETSQSYKDTDLKRTKLKFIIDKDKINLRYVLTKEINHKE